ncbi:hypothetical protein IFM89_016104 [Coptis chinensis]|uniref:Uncharacterized protein n=1 Tax=Coptis chinensis TaxID=261450 RepID=A0A835HU13_9MAGN|nr:hypothetical protein IFM89_016104 [Coptis chinensis]
MSNSKLVGCKYLNFLLLHPILSFHLNMYAGNVASKAAGALSIAVLWELARGFYEAWKQHGKLLQERSGDIQVTRPATVREGKSTLQSFRDDEEVDAKADDFINKFKNQLKLQRLDSILRYKEMLGRGADK